MNTSILITGNTVAFPEFTGERIYLQPFRLNNLSALGRWYATVEAMVDGVDTDDELYLTVDQGFVAQGFKQRREGIHIDCEVIREGDVYAHGGSTPRHTPHPVPTHRPTPRHGSSVGGGIIIAADQTGSRAWRGDFSGDPSDGGDCSHVNVSGMEEVIIEPFRSYVGNGMMLHETLPAAEDQLRTFVRVSLPSSYVVGCA